MLHHKEDPNKKDEYLPKECTKLEKAGLTQPGIKIIDIGCGRHHSLFLVRQNNKNDVYSIGRNVEGELCLGYSSGEDKEDLCFVERLKNKNIVKVVCGSIHSIFINQNGEAFGVGWGRHGQIGFGKQQEDVLEPKKTLITEKIIDAYAGWTYTLFITQSKEIYKAGVMHGEDKIFIPMKINDIIPFSKGEKLLAVHGGEYRCVILGTKNGVFKSGTNDDFDIKSRLVFMEEKEFSYLKKKKKFVDVKCGAKHMVIACMDGTVYGKWHKDADEKFTSYQKDSFSKKAVLMDENVCQIECGSYQTFFIHHEFKIHVSGSNSSGNLGIGHNKEVIDCVYNPHIKNLKPILDSAGLNKLWNLLNDLKYIDVTIITI